MDTQEAFAQALRQLRKAKGLSQEDFEAVTSRTYLSSLERGLKSPTLRKLEAIAGALGVQPFTLLLATYSQGHDAHAIDILINQAKRELVELGLDSTARDA